MDTFRKIQLLTKSHATFNVKSDKVEVAVLSIDNLSMMLMYKKMWPCKNNQTYLK